MLRIVQSPRKLPARRQRKPSTLGMSSKKAKPMSAEDQFKRAFLRAGGRQFMPIGSKFLELAGIGDAPAWLELPSRQRDEAIDHLRRVFETYGSGAGANTEAARLKEMIWCLCAYSVRPRSRGRKRKWLNGGDGFDLAEAVEMELHRQGWRRSDRKAVRRAIAAIKELDDTYEKYSESRLRDAYYDALPAYRKFLLDRPVGKIAE